MYAGAFNKVRKFAQKRYFLWTIREILEIINGSKLLDSSEGENFCFKFGKDITFRQLYDVMKRHKEYIFNKTSLGILACVRSARMVFFWSMA